jgi:ketosteroid isomerase-like protein
VRASEQTLDLIRNYYASMDGGRLADCEQYFAPDASITIAHNPPMQGWDVIFRMMQAGLSVAESIRHEVKNAWEEDDETVIFEVVAHYVLKNGREIAVPGVVIAEVSDGRFISQRIGADLSPVYNS